jgi:hypothetical protein
MSVSAKLVACKRVAIVLVASLVIFAALCAESRAQLCDPTKTPNPRLKGMIARVVTDLRNQAFGSTTRAQFDEYFTDYQLLFLAQPPEENANKLPEVRRDLRTKYFLQGKSGAPYNRLNELAFDMAKEIIKGQFSEQIKYNAMMVIADLNEQEADLNARLPAKPLADATRYMLVAVKSPRVPDYLRVPALLGLQRHVESNSSFPIPSDAREQLIRSMIDLAGQQKPAANRTPEAQAWLRRLAIQILGTLGESGVQGGSEVVDAVVSTVRDPNNLLSVRCAAAQALGEVKLPAANLKAGKIANELGALADTVTKAELAFAKEQGGVPNRRRLKALYFNILTGIGLDEKRGIGAIATTDAERESIKTIRNSLVALIKYLDAEKVTSKDLQQKAEPLEKFKGSGKGPAAAPALAPASPAPAAAVPAAGAVKPLGAASDTVARTAPVGQDQNARTRAPVTE